MYEKIRRLMDERGVTAYEVSKATGIRQATISNWKSGKSSPGVKALAKMADYFKVPVGYFYDDDGQTQINNGTIGGDQIQYGPTTIERRQVIDFARSQMFSKIMRLARERGLTLNRLGREAGISSGNIYDWKSGRSRPKLQTLQKLADYFKVPVSYFIENDDGDEDGKVVQHIHNCEISGEVKGVKHDHECSRAAMLDGLNDEELDRVREYIEFIKSKKVLEGLTVEELDRVREYVEFIKSKRER